jgi:hypothetical protein
MILESGFRRLLKSFDLYPTPSDETRTFNCGGLGIPYAGL